MLFLVLKVIFHRLSHSNSCCLFGFNVAFNNFSVISRRCLVVTLLYCCLTEASCPRQLTWYHICHIILTMGRPVLALTRKSECQARNSYTTVNDFGMLQPGLNPWPPVPRSGHTTDWATGAGLKELNIALDKASSHDMHNILIAFSHNDRSEMRLLSFCVLRSRSWFRLWQLPCNF